MNVNHLPPSFVQQADALMVRIASLPIDEREQRELAHLQQEKHDLLTAEAKFLKELTAWADKVEAEVNYRKALEESKNASERYYRTMDELREVPAFKGPEIAPAEPQTEAAA